MSKNAFGTSNPNAPFWVMMMTAERGILRGAARQCGGNIARAARLLGIDTRTFKKRAFACEAMDLLTPVDIERRTKWRTYHAQLYQQEVVQREFGSKESEEPEPEDEDDEDEDDEDTDDEDETESEESP